VKRWLLAVALAGALACATAAAPTTAALQPPAAVANQPIPYKQQESEAGGAAGKSILLLAVLLGVAWGGLVLAKRTLPRWALTRRLGLAAGAPRRLRLVETMRLGPRASLYLVQLDQKTLLLAQSGDRITVAATDPDAGPIDQKDNEVANHP
jgi:flagellar biogenesis protein FliO